MTTIEQQIQAAGADKAPRITPDDLAANIVGEHYFTAADGVAGAFTNAQVAQGRGVYPDEIGQLKTELRLLTFCVLVLRNGFTVTGESACASPENFNADIGCRIARDNAVAKVWPLMGYELKERLHREARGDVNQHANEQLRWHGQLRNDLMELLDVRDPQDIFVTVSDLKHRMDGLSK